MKFINKKFFIGLTMLLTLLASVSCSPRSKAMEAIKDKEGIFAILTTERGEIVLQLFYKEAPLTVTNFVGLAEGTLDAAKGKPFYDGLKFHRVISVTNGDGQDFMIQGGDPLGNGTGGPGYKFPDEVVPFTFAKPGKLAMANSGADTNGSQFFITIAPTEWLNGKHTIFGEVVSGQAVVNKTKQNDVIKSIKIVRNGEEAKAFSAKQADFDRLVVEAKEKREKAEKEAFDKLVEGCTKSGSGTYFKVLEKGEGKKAGENVNVTVEYIGYLPNGQVFDASRAFHPQGHEPLSFTTGAGEMIPGFDEMVQDMAYGETRKMVIPPELAYGAYGIPQAGIPGNSYICFDVKLVK
ncbi:MAG: peptidylprolyl isomerase [Treponema sp.]|nr:peptidylprolyl isomerase [Treponema sp.]